MLHIFHGISKKFLQQISASLESGQKNGHKKPGNTIPHPAENFRMLKSALVSVSPLEPIARFLFLFDNRGFLVARRSLWRENGSLIYSYNCFWTLQEQSLWDPSSAEFRPCFTVSFETPLTWRVRCLYLYPPGQGGPVIPRALGSLFIASYDFKGYGGDILNPPPYMVNHYVILWQLPDCNDVREEAEDIVGICHQSTTAEKTVVWQDFLNSVVNSRLC
jgi:hypothetical protein